MNLRKVLSACLRAKPRSKERLNAFKEALLLSDTVEKCQKFFSYPSLTNTEFNLIIQRIETILRPQLKKANTLTKCLRILDEVDYCGEFGRLVHKKVIALLKSKIKSARTFKQRLNLCDKSFPGSGLWKLNFKRALHLASSREEVELLLKKVPIFSLQAEACKQKLQILK